MIDAQDLQYRYPQGPVLRFADVHLPQGGVLLVQGPSGAGKSTWLALVAGLLTAAQGRLAVAGQDLLPLGAAQRDAWRGRSIGFLPQRLHLSPLLTVAKNLQLAFIALGMSVDHAAIARRLAQLGVADLAQRKPAQLSGGQAQRVALARALLMGPQLIMADEPTASLDDEAAQQSLQLLQSCAQEQGASLVLATHDARVQQFFQGQSGLQTLQILRSQQ